MKIVNLEAFKQKCTEFSRPELKALLFHFAFERILRELVLVDALHCCRKNGELIPKTEVLAGYVDNLEGERVLIGLLGRREAAKVYGFMEQITSDVKTVDYVLTNDSVEHYQRLVSAEIVLPKEPQKK
jgi:hypothetical protein